MGTGIIIALGLRSGLCQWLKLTDSQPACVKQTRTFAPCPWVNRHCKVYITQSSWIQKGHHIFIHIFYPIFRIMYKNTIFFIHYICFSNVRLSGLALTPIPIAMKNHTRRDILRTLTEAPSHNDFKNYGLHSVGK